MKSLWWISCAAPASLLLCFAGVTAQAQVTQGQLVDQLRLGDRAAQFSATQRVLDMGPEHADPSVREALISALAEEGDLQAAWRRGDAPRPEHPEMIARMAWVVSQWEEPQVIEPLAKALGTGSGAIRGLVRFGEPAVRATVEAARTREGIGSTAIATDALLALRFLAEGVGRTPLSDSSRELITMVARERLEPRQPYAPILRRAIDLAVVLGDPELMAIVEAMASDPAEVEARLENPEPERVEQTRRWAAERLSGEPPRARWEEWSQF